MAEAYRRIRNTARYILGNISDFDPAKDRVAYEDMTEIDKWAVHKLETLKNNVTVNYDKFEFYNLFHEIHYFAGVDMSAFYLDIIKDRLYTEKLDSQERRAAQTVMFDTLTALIKMISPVLSFTAEEIWAAMPAVARDAESVHLSSWYNENPQFINNELGAKWDKIIKLRKEVNKVLEKARQGENRIIGNSLDAEVTLVLSNEEYKELANETELLEMVFIVSKLSFGSITDDTFTESEELKGIFVKVTHAPGENVKDVGNTLKN